MKKLLLVLPAMLLLAAACNNQPAQRQNGQMTAPPSAQTGQTQPPANQPDQTQAPSAQTDPTANWKTYTSPKYEFEIKYPQDWNLNTSTVVNSPNLTAIEFTPPNSKGGPKISVFVSSSSLEAYLKNVENNFGITKKTSSTLGGISAISITWGPPGDTREIMGVKSGNLYIVGGSMLNSKFYPGDQTNYESIYEQMVETFELTS